MSGFALAMRSDGVPLPPGTMAAMTAAMETRARDGAGHWQQGNVGLGQCLTRTGGHDLASAAPWSSDCGTVIIAMDGYLTYRHELENALHESVGLDRQAAIAASDAGLVASAYLAWGRDCVSRLDGEFAFVIWDKRSKLAFCARDQIGLRPLQYYFDGTLLLVASDPAAILAAMPVEPTLNPGALLEAATDSFYTPDETIWQDVMRLRPAHWLAASAAGLSLERYWQLPTRVSAPFSDEADYVVCYRTMLEECVTQACKIDGPVACEASGGLDSSALFALARHLHDQGAIRASSVRGYSLAAAPGSEADESAYVDLLERKLKTPIARVPLFTPELGWFRELALKERDLPTYPNAAMLLATEQAATADNCKAIINGLGGDQWLDGTHDYFVEAIRAGEWALLSQQFAALRRDEGTRHALAMLRRHGIVPLVAPGLQRSIQRRRQGAWPNWLSQEARDMLSERRARSEADLPDTREQGYKIRRLEKPKQLLLLEKLSRQAAIAGIDARSPMLSRRFVEFCATTPEHTRRQGSLTKVIHRKAMADLLPSALVERNDKAEFQITFTRHFGEIATEIPDLRRALPKEWINPKVTKKIGTDRGSAMLDGNNPWLVWSIWSVMQLQLKENRHTGSR